MARVRLLPEKERKPEPIDIMEEMYEMARLHPNVIWASIMHDGADCIAELLRE